LRRVSVSINDRDTNASPGAVVTASVVAVSS
jgi:hypothetical protein